jgi:hypothetical protein
MIINTKRDYNSMSQDELNVHLAHNDAISDALEERHTFSWVDEGGTLVNADKLPYTLTVAI